MHTLAMPQCFPSPQHMKNCTIQVWTTWIRKENNNLLAAIDEEIAMRADPDDPFDGTASGIFTPLRQEDQAQVQAAVEPGLDESRSQNASNTQKNRLVDLPTPKPKENRAATDSTNQGIDSGPPQQPQPPQSAQAMTNKEVDSEQQNIQPQASTSRRIEESTQHPRQASMQTNNVQQDPFMSLRILHEQQRAEKQWSEPPRQSTSSHSTLEGAVGGANYRKPQRQNGKQHQNKKYPTQQQEISQIQREQSLLQQDSYLFERENMWKVWYHGSHKETMQGRSLLQVLQKSVSRNCSMQNLCKLSKIGPCDIE